MTNKGQEGWQDEAGLAADRNMPPLAWHSQAPGVSHFFSASRRSYVAYRISDAVAVTLGEPYGAAHEIPSLILDFEQFCLHEGLLICWWHVTSRWLSNLQRSGSRVALIGGYATLSLHRLSLIGQHWRDARNALRRLPALGYSAHWQELSREQKHNSELAGINASWLARRRLPEIGYSIGTWELSLRRADSLRCLVLRDPGNQAVAFMTFAPLYGETPGHALDLMRGLPGLPRDSMLFLLLSAALSFKAEGAQSLALGLAPLSRSSDVLRPPSLRKREAGEDTPLLLRAGRKLAWLRSRHSYNFRGLALFKQRLQPGWEPRYVLYPGLASLPRVLKALCHVHGLRARSLLRLLAG